MNEIINKMFAELKASTEMLEQTKRNWKSNTQESQRYLARRTNLRFPRRRLKKHYEKFYNSRINFGGIFVLFLCLRGAAGRLSKFSFSRDSKKSNKFFQNPKSHRRTKNPKILLRF